MIKRYFIELDNGKSYYIFGLKISKMLNDIEEVEEATVISCEFRGNVELVAQDWDTGEVIPFGLCNFNY